MSINNNNSNNMNRNVDRNHTPSLLQYRQLSTNDSDINELELEMTMSSLHDEILEGEDIHDKRIASKLASGTMRNEGLVPISRAPTKHRDRLFALMFIFHFAAIAILSFLEEKSLHNSLITYGRAGSWASMLMIVTVLGSFGGGIISYLITNVDIRESFLSLGLLVSITLQICLGNILLLLRARFSFAGVFLILSALSDALIYKQARDNINFTVCKSLFTTFSFLIANSPLFQH